MGRLPDVSGIDLLRKLKSQYGMPDIPVTSFVVDSGAIETEGFNFLATPVNLQSLIGALQSLQA